MGGLFLDEAQPSGTIGFHSIAPNPRRLILASAAVLTIFVAVSLAVRGSAPDRSITFAEVAFLWLWAYFGVPAWNRYLVAALCRLVLPGRPRDREQFFRFFEAGFFIILIWVLVGQLLLLWGVIT